MAQFKIFPWLILFFGVCVPVTALLLNGAEMSIFQALGIGGVAGLMALIIAGVLTGKGDFDRMMIDELDAGGKLN